ncbi:MAG TPA: PQQ-binding-like beta-propeller repeat protein, partial [Bryobacteraceae bacterium]|nr:PQQ-binding-like beta-propeller repeat protein [Bryobacteraceae bacterium]
MRPILIGLTFAALCSGQAMFRGDAAHSGVYADAGPRQLHGVKWRFATGDRLVSSPVFSDGVLYFGGDDDNVYAVDAASGRQKWKFATRGPVPCTPAVVAGLLYFGSYDGHF